MRIIFCFRGHYQRQRCAPRLRWTNSITVSKTPMKIALSFVIRGTSTAAKLEQELGLSGVPFPTNCKVRQTSSAFPRVRAKCSCQAVFGNCHQCLLFHGAGFSNLSLLCQIFVKKNLYFCKRPNDPLFIINENGFGFTTGTITVSRENSKNSYNMCIF